MTGSFWRGRGDPANNSLQLWSTRTEQRCLAFILSFLMALGAREGQGLLFSFYRWQNWAWGGNRLLALPFKTNALYNVSCWCPSTHPPIHPSVHSSTHPPTHSPVYLYFLPIPIYPRILQERKKMKGSFGREAHPWVWTQKESFLANNAISLGICSPALPWLLPRLLASPSFPLLTGLLPAVSTCSQVPTIVGTFFLLSGLLLIHQIGRTPGLSRLPLQLGFHG